MLLESLTVGLSCLCLCLMTLKCLLNQCIEIEAINEVIRTKDENNMPLAGSKELETKNQKECELKEEKENINSNIVTKPDINKLSDFQITFEPKLIKVLNTINEEADGPLADEAECIKKLSDYIKESLSENELRELETVLKQYQNRD